MSACTEGRQQVPLPDVPQVTNLPYLSAAEKNSSTVHQIYANSLFDPVVVGFYSRGPQP